MKEKLKNTPKVWTDPDDALELDQAFFEKATPYVDGKSVSLEVFKQAVIKRGRPPAEVTKSPVKLRLDPDILDAMRASGKGWQTKVNALLKDAVKSGQFPPASKLMQNDT